MLIGILVIDEINSKGFENENFSRLMTRLTSTITLLNSDSYVMKLYSINFSILS